jgi:ATP-dependent DNA helicase RecG
LDYLALECLQQEKPLSAPLRERLAGLLAAGAVESVGRGKGRYILSEALYASLGAKGTHTRQRGLDRETNKALLLKHLTKHREHGAALAELRQVLPSLPMSAVRDLLKELRNEGAPPTDGCAPLGTMAFVGLRSAALGRGIKTGP